MTGTDTHSQNVWCFAQYRKDNSADTSLSAKTCLYLRKRECSLAMVCCSVLPT